MNSLGHGEIREPFVPSISSTRSKDENPPTSMFQTSLKYKALQQLNERQNLIQAFLCKCFPKGWASRSTRSWLPLLSELPTKADGELLELSGLALAASNLGRGTQNLYLMNLGLKCYTQGLRLLRRALRHPDLMKEDATLAACMTLNLYEIIECPGRGSDGYFGHCHGLLAMIQARGVSRHSSGAGHRLFLGIRIPGVSLQHRDMLFDFILIGGKILYALNHGVTTVLQESSRMEDHWEDSPKAHLDRVTDCLVSAPGILERVPLLPYLNPPQQVELVWELVEEYWQVDRQLDIIEAEMNSTSSIYTTVPSTINPLAELGIDFNFPIAYTFRDSTLASTFRQPVRYFGRDLAVYTDIIEPYKNANIQMAHPRQQIVLLSVLR